MEASTEVREAIIPSSTGDNFLLRLFHRHVGPCERPFSYHHHIEFEIALFKAGSGLYSLVDRSYDIQPGDVFLFSSNEMHSITRIDVGCEMVLMNIHFEPRFIWSAGNDLFDAKYLQIFFNRSPNFQNRLDRNNPATQHIIELLLTIEREFRQKSAEYVLMVKAELLILLVTLIRGFDYVAVGDQYLSRYHFDRIDTAMEYIHQHLEEDITLEEIATAANISRTYFCTIFKKLNGITPWEYIIAKRVERAEKMLENQSDATMTTIAGLCGFNNTANFNRAFRKHTAMTPSEYKMKHHDHMEIDT